MGSGEFDGGGSVKWKITHSDGDHGKGGPHGGAGRDKDPKGENPFFIVSANGTPIFTWSAAEGNTITVEWGPSSTAVAAATKGSAVLGGGAKRAFKKKRASKRQGVR